MKTFVFDEKKVEIIQLALKVLIDTLDGKDVTSASLREDLAKRLQEYSEELFASAHSQGG
jgi:hypothetical protein